MESPDSYNYSEANAAANWLANHGLNKNTIDRSSCVVSDSPLGFFLILYHDLIESIVPRLI